MLNTHEIRKRLPFLMEGIDLSIVNSAGKNRISLDSTATTPPSVDALEVLVRASFDYAAFERGGSESGIKTSMAMLQVYNLIANLIGADSYKEIILGRNTTEMIGHVAHTLRGEFKGFPRFQSGQNVVTTYLEHNSNYLPWKELCDFFRVWEQDVELRLVNVDSKTGLLDMKDLSRKVDRNTRVVAVTAKSNVLATTPDLTEIGEIAHRNGALFLVDAAQYVPNHFVDVKSLDVDLLAFSFHKMLGPWGVGALYGKREILEAMPSFLPGGGTVNDIDLKGVDYYGLPQKFISGSPDSLGVIATGESLYFLINAALGYIGQGHEPQKAFTRMVMNAPSIGWDLKYMTSTEEGRMIRENAREIGREDVLTDMQKRREYSRELIEKAMGNIAEHEIYLTERVLDGLRAIPNIVVYGNLPAEQRYGLVPFNVGALESRQVGFLLNQRGIEIRSDQHCAHLLHKCVLKVPGTSRVSLAIYNTPEEVDLFLEGVREVAKNV